MASVRKQVLIDADPDRVWDALRDWASPHLRLARGFITAARLDGEDRIVTLFNGTESREVLIDLDDKQRRLVWSKVGGLYTHHNASAQVFPAEGGGSEFVWIADFLPDENAERVEQMMERGIAAVRETLNAPSA